MEKHINIVQVTYDKTNHSTRLIIYMFISEYGNDDFATVMDHFENKLLTADPDFHAVDAMKEWRLLKKILHKRFV